jgi:predicted enzyme related to lactoylglutathione lyase
MKNQITKLDFIGVPSTDADRSRTFYIDTLGLKPDEKATYEFWVGDTCFAIWEPEKMGMSFTPQKGAHIALHTDDIESTRKELEERGVEFLAQTIENPVCFMALFTDPDGNDLMLHSVK